MINRRARVDLQHRAVKFVQEAQTTGRVILHAPGKQKVKGRGVRTSQGLLFGTTGPQGGISVDPATSFSWKFRRTLNWALGRRSPYPPAPIRLLNPDGSLREEVSFDEFVARRRKSKSGV